MCINQEIVLTRVLTKQVVLYLLSVLVEILYMNQPAMRPFTYRICFNFHGVKLSRIASFHGFHIFNFAVTGS